MRPRNRGQVAPAGVAPRHRSQQALRVGMTRRIGNSAGARGVRALDDTARVHHQHPVTRRPPRPRRGRGVMSRGCSLRYSRCSRSSSSRIAGAGWSRRERSSARSAISSAELAGQRHRDHHPLLESARRARCGVLLQAPLGVGHVHLRAASSRTRASIVRSDVRPPATPLVCDESRMHPNRFRDLGRDALHGIERSRWDPARSSRAHDPAGRASHARSSRAAPRRRGAHCRRRYGQGGRRDATATGR